MRVDDGGSMIPLVRTWAFAMIALALACRSNGPSGPQGGGGSIIGQMAPDFTAVRLDGGGSVQLSSLRGRVVVLNLWAAWCEGCEKDLPVFDDITARLASCGAAVMAVSLDSDTRRVLPLVRSRTWKMMMLHDASGGLGDLYEPAKMPAVYVIDERGTVRHAWVGVERDHIHAVETAAQSLCAAKGKP